MAEIVKTEGEELADALERAAELITAGKVIALPTDTVYGLGADPFNLAAVVEVFRVKGRGFSRPLPLLVDSMDLALELVSGPPGLFFDLARKYWPGPLTLVVPASSLVPLKVTGNTRNVGLRWPKAPLATALIAAAARPLTGTSANRTNHSACSTADEVNQQLGSRLPLILDGGSTAGNAPSTVVDLTASPPRIIRPGPIPESELKELLS